MKGRQFGTISYCLPLPYRCRNENTGDYFALKALHKQLIMDKRQQESIFRERESKSGLILNKR